MDLFWLRVLLFSLVVGLLAGDDQTAIFQGKHLTVVLMHVNYTLFIPESYTKMLHCFNLKTLRSCPHQVQLKEILLGTLLASRVL